MITLNSTDITAYDLEPKDVTEPVRVTRSYTLSPEIKFKEVSGSIGGIKKEVTYIDLEPIISVFGIGESTFYWVHRAIAGSAVTPEAKHAFIILQAPHGTRSISGVIQYEAVIAQRLFGSFELRNARSDRLPLHLNLL